MSYEYSEDGLVEQSTEDILTELGWQVVKAWTREDLGENSLLGREHKMEVILRRDLRDALERFNPALPEQVYQTAISTFAEGSAGQEIVRINQAKYDFIKNGIPVSYRDTDGAQARIRLKIVDFKDPQQNKFLAVRQLEVDSELHPCRPDVVGYVNGIPLIFFELKAINVYQHIVSNHYGGGRSAYATK